MNGHRWDGTIGRSIEAHVSIQIGAE